MLNYLKRPLILALLILAGAFGLLYWLRETLMPVLIAAIIAYIFMPLVNGLARRGCRRPLAALLVTSAILLSFTGLLLWLIPQVAGELANSRERVQQGISHFENYYPRIQSIFPDLPDPADPAWKEQLRDQLLALTRDHLKPLLLPTGKLLAGVGGTLAGLLVFLIELLFVPVFLFYLLNDGPQLMQGIAARVPATAAPKFALLLETLDATLRAYVRSAAEVVGVLVFVYSAAFLVIGMPLALPLALFCAAAHWVPYLGTAVATLLCALLVFLHHGADWRIAAAAGIIFALHLLETLFITPRLVGKGIKMHPLFVILALLLGVRFFGVGGLILALPAAAMIAGLLPILLPERAAAPAPTPDPPSPS